jgi:hypothetical protein
VCRNKLQTTSPPSTYTITKRKTKKQEKDYSSNIFSKIKARNYCEPLFELILAVPTFPVRLQTSIISAVDLTAVFGMGTGVSLQLYPPETYYVNASAICSDQYIAMSKITLVFEIFVSKTIIIKEAF